LHQGISGHYGNLPARSTDVIMWHWGPSVSKMSNLRLSNKDRLSVCSLVIIQRKPNWATWSLWQHCIHPMGWT